MSGTQPVSKRSQFAKSAPVPGPWPGSGDIDQAASALILTHVRDGVVVQDLQARIEWVNPACEEMFGWTLDEMRGRRPQDFLIPPEVRPLPNELADFRYDLTSPIFEHNRIVECQHRDGTRFWTQLSFAIVDTGTGEALEKVVITCRNVSDQVRTEQALRQVQVDLEYAAHHDELTGLANRKMLTKYLLSEQIKAQIARRDIGVLQIDIDKFKEVNDTLGHAAGDATLAHVAEALREKCRPDDLVCRTGGDEFLLFCPGLSTASALTQQAEVIRAAIEAPLQWTSQVIRVGASIGASLPPHPDTSGEALIQMADQALYEAKNRGRGRVVVYTETLGRAQTAQIKLARDLRVAVAEKQFEIYLQPQLCLRRARIIGCEALLRWRHPDRGLLRPGAFLRAAERNGLLTEVDYLSMTLALDALQMLRSNGFDGVGMALNVSSTVLADVNYPGLLNWALQARGIAPEDICVEVLETSILDRNGQDAMKAINRLKQLGVRVALDDFGIGYAGLAHMSTFDIDAIKLDRSMISRLEGDPRNRAVVRSIIRLSDLLGMQVVAEGVETQNQLDILRRTCCPVIQGFGLAHPMPVDKMVAWLRRAHVDGIVQFGGADLNLELTPKPRAS